LKLLVQCSLACAPTPPPESPVLRSFDISPGDFHVFEEFKSEARAVVRFKTRDDAIRAVREKHMTVMRNNEVVVQLLN
jgi:hypothetical protein